MPRALDVGVDVALDIGLPSRTTARPFSAITDVYRLVKSVGIATFKPTSTGGGGSETFKYQLQHSDPPRLYHQNTYDDIDDGSIKLNEGGALQTQIAIPFTQSAVDYRTPIAAAIWVSRLGVPVNSLGLPPAIEVSIYSDSGGSPGVSLGQSYFIGTGDISTEISGILVGFAGSFYPIANGGSYWVVISPTYDADPNNCIQVHYNTVGGTSACKVNSGGWAAIANQDVWYQLYQLTFTDVDDAVLDGGAFNQYQQDVNFVNPIDGAQLRVVDARRLKDYVRFRYIISAGTWYPFAFTIAAYPYELPLVT